jgi:UDP-N-acetylmuramate dehydrogenase
VSDLASELVAAGLKRVKANESMSKHTTWRIGGPADALVVVDTIEDLRLAISIADQHWTPWLVIGAGSNILVADEGIEGLVILNRMRSVSLDRVENGCEVNAESGAFFARVAQIAADSGYTGLEWGVAIPGTVGAGVVNNAGAHSGDVQRTIVNAEVLDSSGAIEVLDPAELRFAYRRSRLKVTSGEPITRTESIVVRVRFAAQTASSVDPRSIIKRLIEQRLATQPVVEPSAGSTFTNPPGASAGALIEMAGLKGHRIGGAEFSFRHANFIVNVDRAAAADVVALVRLARSRVRETQGVLLEPEVQLVGRWNKGETLHEHLGGDG